MRRDRATPLAAVSVLALVAAAAGCRTEDGGYRVEATAAASFDPAALDRVAVVPRGAGRERYGGGESGLDQLLEDAFVPALMRSGYAVASRSDVQRVLEELQFQHTSGLTDSDAAKMGRLLNVGAVILVSVPDVTTEQSQGRSFWARLTGGGTSSREVTRVTVSARMVSIERAEFLWVATATHAFPGGAARAGEFVATLARAVAEEVPSRLAPAPAADAGGGG